MKAVARRDVFPVMHSVLSATALLAEVTEAYAIGAPVACQFLRSRSNDVYLLTTRHERYILRVYRARRSLPEISYELELLVHLAAKGVSVSVPITGKDGSVARAVPAPEGTRYLVLFTYAEGEPISWEDESQSYRAGQLVAMIHSTSDDFQTRHPRFSLDLDRLIASPPAVLRPLLIDRPADWGYLAGFGSRLRARAEAAVATGLDWGVCHGDLGGNIHIGHDRTLTVFDFDSCAPGWRMYDFATVRWVPGVAWDAFLRGYAESRPLGAANLDAIPVFEAACRLFHLGLRASYAADLGLVDKWYIDHDLAFFEKWEAEHPLRRGSALGKNAKAFGGEQPPGLNTDPVPSSPTAAL